MQHSWQHGKQHRRKPLHSSCRHCGAGVMVVYADALKSVRSVSLSGKPTMQKKPRYVHNAMCLGVQHKCHTREQGLARCQTEQCAVALFPHFWPFQAEMERDPAYRAKKFAEDAKKFFTMTRDERLQKLLPGLRLRLELNLYVNS